jgi:hypothetical protein
MGVRQNSSWFNRGAVVLGEARAKPTFGFVPFMSPVRVCFRFPAFSLSAFFVLCFCVLYCVSLCFFVFYGLF